MVRGLSVAVFCVSLLTVGAADAMSGHDEHHHASPAFAFGKPGTASAARTVAITMHDMSFEPAKVMVKSGETVHFVVTNASSVDHDFTLGDPATQEAHRKEMAKAMDMGGMMHHGADANAVMVMAGQTRDVTWTFTRPGTLRFDCNIPGHFEAGMTGEITVSAN